MSNFKSGSGNLDFGGSDSDEEDAEAESEPSQEEATAESQTSSRASEASPDTPPSSTESTSEQQTSDHGTIEASTASESATDTYPYFVRRSNVGDERDTRLEIHVRDKVAEQESAFRNELAEQLGANEVSKTDAREFALLAAYHHPERVAELMREEGFDALY